MADEKPEIYELVLMPWQRDTLLEGLDKDLRQWAQPVAQQIRNQIPIPVPTKIGAVVRTESGRAYVRADGSTTPWISVRLPGVAFIETPDWLGDEVIGRITEVLSEGVDL